MKKRNILYILMSVILPIVGLLSSSYSSGITGQSTSGCSGGGCHAQNLTTTVLSITGIPSNGYVGGTTYSLIATVTNPNYTTAAARGGFNISCTEGTFTATAGVSAPTTTQITHNGAKAMSAGSVSWTISWTAPIGGSGTMVFHFAGNATNGNFMNSGDQPNYDPFPFTEVVTAGVPTIGNTSVAGITLAGATVSGAVNANGDNTIATVEYGTTVAYGSNQLMAPNPITGSSSTSVNATLSGLMPNTTYHYRISAMNSFGTSTSADSTFMTASNVGLQDIELSEYTLAPNPARDIITLNFKENFQLSSLEIYSLTGQKIILSKHVAEPKNVTVDMSNVAKGTYILHAVINQKRLMQKIVVQ